MSSGDHTLIAIALLVGFGALAALAAMLAPSKYPYVKAGPLLSNAERSFLRTLEEAVAGRFRINVKVRVADVLQVKSGLAGKTAIVALNRIAAKHVDYVLSQHGSYLVVAAVELDDSSHALADRYRRDEFLDKSFKAAGVPLVRFKAAGHYSRHLVAQQIEAAIGSPKQEGGGKNGRLAAANDT
jgi:hypothetical protein